MLRLNKDELLARRCELERQLETELERLNAHRSGAVADVVAGLRRQINEIDRRLSASDRARTSHHRRRDAKAAEREAELAMLDTWPPRVSVG